MTEISFLERISKIFGLITSSAFFISLFIIVILTVSFVIVNSKLKLKIPKILAGVGYLIIMIYVIIRYGTALFNVQDGFTDKVFNSFYFPNLITYISIILISVFVFIINFLNKDKTLVFKTISVVSFGTILSLFVITLDIIAKNEEIEIWNASTIYANTDLVIVIQASTAVFFIWMVIELVDYFSRKISLKVDKNNQQNESVNVSDYNNNQNTTVRDYNNNIKQNYLNNYYNQKGYYNYSNYNNYGTYNNSNADYSYYNYNGGSNYNNYNNSNNYSNYYNYSNAYSSYNGSTSNSDYNYGSNPNQNYNVNNIYDTSKKVSGLSNNMFDDVKEEESEYKKVHYLDE